MKQLSADNMLNIIEYEKVRTDYRKDIIEYNNSQVRRVYGSDVSGTRMAQSLFYRNGAHLTLKNGSRMKYYNDLSSISLPSKFGALRFADNHGVGNPQDHVDHKISIPAIQVENSKADLLHARIVASSITDNGAGDYTVTFTTAMASADYCVTGGASDISSGAGYRWLGIGSNHHSDFSKTTNSVRVQPVYTSSNKADAAHVYVVIFGD